MNVKIEVGKGFGGPMKTPRHIIHRVKMTKKELEKLYPPKDKTLMDLFWDPVSVHSVMKKINQINSQIMEAKMYHDVTIQKVSNGFIIKVGCMAIVSTSWKEVANGLEKYWKDPVKAEADFKKKNPDPSRNISGRVLTALREAESEPQTVLPERSGFLSGLRRKSQMS